MAKRFLDLAKFDQSISVAVALGVKSIEVVNIDKYRRTKDDKYFKINPKGFHYGVQILYAKGEGYVRTSETRRMTHQVAERLRLLTAKQITDFCA